MSYKSITTFLSHAERADALLDTIAAFSAQSEAHFEICCFGIDTTQTAGFYAGAPAILYQEMFDAAQARAEALTERVRDIMRPAQTRWSVDSAVLTLGGAAPLVALKARFSDLVILPRPYGPDATPIDEIITEAALFDGKAPVLVLPDPAQPIPSFGKIVLAWNQSDEAMAAARAALPLLRAADTVNLVVIDPPVQGPERSDPGGMLAQLLVRHGCKVEISVIARTLPRTSDVLQRHARDQAADLLVMGAYSHSRLRQAFLGGTTRNLLENAHIPVLMAH